MRDPEIGPRPTTVERTGACRRPDREPKPAGVGCLQRAIGQTSGAGSCEQSGVCQSAAGIAIAEKNRCCANHVLDRRIAPVERRFSRLAVTISAIIATIFQDSQLKSCRILRKSAHGEVAERPKAAVC